jgi:plastocyanin
MMSFAGCLQSQMTEGSIGANMQPMMQMGFEAMVGSPAMDEYPAEPNDEGFVDVAMIAYDDDTNNYHFMPHVVWVEPGTTVRWAHTAKGISERRTHSATAITPELMAGYPRLIPENGASFDSGLLPGSHDSEFDAVGETELIRYGPYTHTFEEKGVYFYLCQPHYGVSGMAGAVVVGELWEENQGEGWSPGMTADLSPIVEADPVNGPVIKEKIEGDLRTMVRHGEEGGEGGGGH